MRQQEGIMEENLRILSCPSGWTQPKILFFFFLVVDGAMVVVVAGSRQMQRFPSHLTSVSRGLTLRQALWHDTW